MPKISALPPDAMVDPGDLFPIVDVATGVTKKVRYDQFSFLQAGAGAVQRLLPSKERANISIEDFGALGGATDDTQAFVKAATYLTSLGGGILRLEHSSYSVTFASGTFTLAAFSSLTLGVKIIGAPSLITVSHPVDGATSGALFDFTSCNQSGVEYVSCSAPNTQSASNPTAEGTCLVRLHDDCLNFTTRDIGQTGGLALMQVVKAFNAAASKQAKGITLAGTSTATGSEYGLNCQYNGDNVIVENLQTNGCGRAYFVYGVKHHRVFIRSKNNTADDVLIEGVDGQGCEDLDISYCNTDSVAPGAGNLGPCCTILPTWGPTILSAPTLRNIRVNITATIDTNLMSRAVKISNGDGVDRGYILENVSLSGSILNTWASFIPLDLFSSGSWGTGNFLRNFKIKDFYVSGASSPSNCFLTSLQNYAKLENVVIPSGDCYITGPTNSRIIVENCEAKTFSNSGADGTTVMFVNTNMTTGTNQGGVNKTFVNTLVGVQLFNMLPIAWCVLDTSGAGAVIKAQAGIFGSPTRVSAGLYEFVLNTTFTQAALCPLASTQHGARMFTDAIVQANNKVRVQCYDSAGVATDPTNYVRLAVFASPLQ